MSKPPQLTLEDYEAIASAVMETERGRWFLAEFARRNRVADTAQVLEALTRLEQRVAPQSLENAGTTACPPAVAEAAAAVRAALMAPKPAELRVELALARLATLERLAKPASDALAPETRSLPEAPIASAMRLPLPEPAALPSVDEPAAVEPERPDDAGERVAASARPAIEAALTTLETPAPAPFASTDSPAVRLAAPRRLAPAARREERPAPAPLPPLLDSLSEAEKALLFA